MNAFIFALIVVKVKRESSVLFTFLIFLLPDYCYHLTLFTSLRLHLQPPHWGQEVGAPVELSDASLTTSINHSPSDHLSPTSFCPSLYVSVSTSPRLAYTTFYIGLIALSHTDMGTAHYINTTLFCCCY